MLKNAFPIGPDGVVVDLFFVPHPRFGFLQLDFQFGRSFHGLAQCSSPFILRVGAVATASHFHTERNSGGKNLDNLRVSDHPCLALPTFRFPTLGHSCLLGFHCSEAASLTHCRSLLCITLPLPCALAPAVATALRMFGQRTPSKKAHPDVILTDGMRRPVSRGMRYAPNDVLKAQRKGDRQ